MPRKRHAASPASHPRLTDCRIDWLPPHAGDRRAATRSCASARRGRAMAAQAAMQGRAGSSGRRPEPVRPLPSTFPGKPVPQVTGAGARWRLPDWLHDSRPVTSACVGERCRGCRAAERIPGPESVTRNRTFVEYQPLARPVRRRGDGPSGTGLLAIANAIGSKVVNAAPAAAARPTRQGARNHVLGVRQPVEPTHVFRSRPAPRRPSGQDEGSADSGGYCSR